MAQCDEQLVIGCLLFAHDADYELVTRLTSVLPSPAQIIRDLGSRALIGVGCEHLSLGQQMLSLGAVSSVNRRRCWPGVAVW